jgi:large subunit ribosomal protein L18
MKLNTSIRKRFRVSNKVKKVASKDRFRLCISRSSKNISAQIIDDINKVTLLSASSVEKDIKSGDKVNKTELSKIVAAKLQKKLKKRKLQRFTLIEVFIDIMVELKYLLKPYVKMEWNFNYGKF